MSQAAVRRRLFLIATVWISTLGMAFLGGVFAYRQRHEIRTFINNAARGGGMINSSLYDLSVTLLPIQGEGRDGGIDALGDGLLLVNRLGKMWFVDDNALVPLDLVVPANIDEFLEDDFNANTDHLDQFGVKDILAQPRDAGIHLLVSYNYWYPEQDCYVLRVSGLEATEDEIRKASIELQSRWRTLFDSYPCMPLLSSSSVTHVPTEDAGGRLVALSEDQILLSVGHFAAPDIRSRDNAYGKVILIDQKTATHRIYTTGHRNPQGMAVASDGTVWLTEHGPRGGDELNRLIEGRDYGFPTVTYGTEYTSLVWPNNPRQGRHDGFEKPVYAWVPSVGISQLMEIRSELFARWEGDLMVSSMDGLNGRSLFRVRLEEGRAVLVEPIRIDHRIRDIAQMKDGTLALKTDDNFLIFLKPTDAANIDKELDPVIRGQAIAGTCAGCHSLSADESSGLGPSLRGIIGRAVASRRDFQYSSALVSIGGTWTRGRLQDYVRDPQSFAPGTLMVPPAKYDERALGDLISYLETL